MMKKKMKKKRKRKKREKRQSFGHEGSGNTRATAVPLATKAVGAQGKGRGSVLPRPT